MNAETIKATIEAWTNDPEKALGAPMVTARADESQAVIQAGPFTWRADLPPALGGTNQAPSPTALLLGALAGCAVVFVRDTLLRCSEFESTPSKRPCDAKPMRAASSASMVQSPTSARSASTSPSRRLTATRASTRSPRCGSSGARSTWRSSSQLTWPCSSGLAEVLLLDWNVQRTVHSR